MNKRQKALIEKLKNIPTLAVGMIAKEDGSFFEVVVERSFRYSCEEDTEILQGNKG